METPAQIDFTRENLNTNDTSLLTGNMSNRSYRVQSNSVPIDGDH